MNPVIPIAMIVMGAAIAMVWTRDIIFNDEIDLSNGFFQARDRSSDGLFWPHWLAEYGTALVLLAGGIGLLLDITWAYVLSPFALGALFYTSLNSLGWSLARRERFAYAVPMMLGLVVAAYSLWVMLGQCERY